MSRIGGIQKNIQTKRKVGGLRKLEWKLEIEMHEHLKKKDQMWFQLSMEKWLVDRDINTKHYHLQTVQRRRRNNIVMIKNEVGQWVDDDKQVRQMFINNYKDLFALNDARLEWEQTEYTFP